MGFVFLENIKPTNNNEKKIARNFERINEILNGLVDYQNIQEEGIKGDNIAPGAIDIKRLTPRQRVDIAFKDLLFTSSGTTLSWTAGKLYIGGVEYTISASSLANAPSNWIIFDITTQVFELQALTVDLSTLAENKVVLGIVAATAVKDANNVDHYPISLINDNASEINASRINCGTLNAALAQIANINANTITTGELVGRVIKTASSGQRIVINETANTIEFYNSYGVLRERIEGLTDAIRHRIYQTTGTYWDILFNRPGVGSIADFADITLAQSGVLSDSAVKQIVTGQWGSHDFGSVGAGVTATYAVTFPTTFLLTPRPIVGVTAGDVAHAGFAESTTGFTLWIRNNGATQNVVAHWLAVGS